MIRRLAMLALVLGAVAAPGLTAQEAGSEAALLPTEPAITHHTGTFNGTAVSYTAEAGVMPIRENGEVAAQMFYVAYTQDGADPGTRPLIISFNGGPGSASVWMHMGYTGPRHITYDDEGFAMRPPGGVEDNPHSILDVADIVYVDPIATGFSRMVEGQPKHRYHGTDEDIASMGEFIRLYVTRTGRWTSPKFIIGESYGTARASGLAGHMQSAHSMFLNGVILVSMTGLGVERGEDIGNATQIPVYTATAWYHERLPEDLQRQPLRDVLDQSEAFAMGPYLDYLVKGDGFHEAERDEVAAELARYTGISPGYLLEANLRVSRNRFRKELMRDERLTVGRLDSRYTGVDSDAAGESYDYDPAMADWFGNFTVSLNQYLREELGYDPDLEYNIFGPVRPWNRASRMPVGQMLRGAMSENPYLKVLVQAGYFDMATDYFSAQYTMSHLQHGGELRDRIRFTHYESGHMMYLRDEDLARSNDDIRDFIAWALADNPAYPR